MSDPTTMTPAFSAEHDQAAAKEGWGIFDCAGSEWGRWQICRIDSQDDPEGVQLAEDIQALAIVLSGKGAHHQAARDFIEAHNPLDYQAMLDAAQLPIFKVTYHNVLGDFRCALVDKITFDQAEQVLAKWSNPDQPFYYLPETRIEVMIG